MILRCHRSPKSKRSSAHKSYMRCRTRVRQVRPIVSDRPPSERAAEGSRRSECRSGGRWCGRSQNATVLRLWRHNKHRLMVEHFIHSKLNQLRSSPDRKLAIKTFLLNVSELIPNAMQISI